MANGVENLKRKSAVGRWVVLLSILPIAFGCSGCASRADGEVGKPGLVLLTKQDLAEHVAQSLGSSGMPEPPLARDASRAQRKEYLSAAEEAYGMLLKLPAAPEGKAADSNRLLLEDQNAQILEISKLLAVELADAIDRADARRAEEALRLAVAYADSVAGRSVPDWTASGAVSDTLSLGVKSVSGQLDDEMVTKLVAVLTGLEGLHPEPSAVLASDSKRILAWFASVKANAEPVPVQSVPMIVGIDPEVRSRPTEDLLGAVRPLAAGGKVAHDVMVKECGLSAEAAGAYLLDPKGEPPTIDPKAHPIGALVLSVLTPTLTAAPNLVALRAENLRLVALTLRIASMEPPIELASLGDAARSPVSGMLFELKQADGSFDLIRPRPKVGTRP